MGVSINNFYRTERASSYSSQGGIAANWDDIPHKGMDALSKDEIKQRVRELGVEAANATTEQEKDKIGNEIQNLFNQYVSYVSPDRKSLYEQAIKTIKEQSGGKNQSANINEPKTLFDYLNERDGIGKGMKFDRTYPMSGGGTVSAGEVTGGGAIFDVSYQGESILSIHAGCIKGNGVYYSPTTAEQEMMKEISNVYYRARDNANSAQTQTSNFVTDGSVDIRV